MIYMDLEKIYRERDIPNKYILTLVISARARQLSERRDLSGEEPRPQRRGEIHLDGRRRRDERTHRLPHSRPAAEAGK